LSKVRKGEGTIKYWKKRGWQPPDINTLSIRREHQFARTSELPSSAIGGKDRQLTIHLNRRGSYSIVY